ncbi:MAG TPA: hypothetical protein VER79_11385, partial [Candidatus Limnocylindrales bacterium]|nr:hypothetical protein [Candidatus Limnocylindrales bacterium]
MLEQTLSPAMQALHNRIDLINIPFTDRGTRLLLFVRGSEMSIRMAERWSKWESEYGHYRQRVPIIERFQFTDAAGKPLALTTETYPHAIQLTTEKGAFAITFIDPETLLMRLPAGAYGLEFTVMASEAQADRRGGTLHGKRNLSYTT